jgi:hypothetical protein
VKVQNVFTYQNELVDSMLQQYLDDISLEHHDVIVNGVIPLTNKFDYCESERVIRIEYFDVKRFRTD